MPKQIAAILAAQRDLYDFGSPWTHEQIQQELAMGNGLGLTQAGSTAAVLEAFLLWRESPDADEIMLLATLPSAARKGNMRKLLIEYRARRRPNIRTILEVRADNEPARCLYSSLGMLILGERKSYYRDGEPAIIYQWP